MRYPYIANCDRTQSHDHWRSFLTILVFDGDQRFSIRNHDQGCSRPAQKTFISVIWRCIIYMDRNNLVCCLEQNTNVPMKIMFLSWTSFKLDVILFMETIFSSVRQGSPNTSGGYPRTLLVDSSVSPNVRHPMGRVMVYQVLFTMTLTNQEGFHNDNI